MADTYTVTSASELQTALTLVASGGTILLQPGNYGALDISNRDFTSFVTLRSADLQNRAVMTAVTLNNASFIRLDGLHVSSGSNGAPGSKIMQIINGSRNIEIINCEVNGLVDGNFDGHYGIYVDHSDVVSLYNNNVHDVHDGIVAFSVRDFVVRENFVDYVGSDNFKFGGLTGVLIENNTGGGNLFANAGAHADFMQFQAATRDAVIRGNVFLAQNSERPQGIFMGSDFLQRNILIENNIIYSGKSNAIRIKQGTDIIVRNNTLLTTPWLGHESANIRVPPGSIVENNISTASEGRYSGSNIIAQYDDPGDIYYYGDLFLNAFAGPGIRPEDLRPVPGSPAATTGAWTRLQELLNARPGPESAPESAPGTSPPPEVPAAPASDPTAVPAAEDKAGYSDGPSDFYPRLAAVKCSTGAAATDWTSQQVFFAYGEAGWFENSSARTRAEVRAETTISDPILIPPASDFLA
jgi:Right handed beta helix region